MSINFLEPEIRCDFYVDEKRKKIWKIELDLFEKFSEVCTKYGLKYFAFAGTLLGAIRHDGFIPWDDDLDVAMLREDYDVLCTIASQEFKGDFFFQNLETDINYFLGFSRLRYSNSTGIILNKSEHKYNNGIFIDIYVYDKIPDDDKVLDKLILKIKNKRRIIDNYYYLSPYLNNSWISNFAKIFFHTYRKFVSREKIVAEYYEVCKLYLRDKTERLGFLCSPELIKNYIVSQSSVSELIPHKFEYLDIMIPKNYDELLRKAYGNYMEYPPVEKRGDWHENIILFDPDISFIEFYRNHSDRFENVLKEYGE